MYGSPRRQRTHMFDASCQQSLGAMANARVNVNGRVTGRSNHNAVTHSMSEHV
jgi:hypothetical protein